MSNIGISQIKIKNQTYDIEPPRVLAFNKQGIACDSFKFAQCEQKDYERGSFFVRQPNTIYFVRDTNTNEYSLPLRIASEQNLGGIKARAMMPEDINEVHIDPATGRLYTAASITVDQTISANGDNSAQTLLKSIKIGNIAYKVPETEIIFSSTRSQISGAGELRSLIIGNQEWNLYGSGASEDEKAQINNNTSAINQLKNNKQNKLIPGEGINIEGNTISTTGSGATEEQIQQIAQNKSDIDQLSKTKQNKLIPGDGIIIHGNVISSTGGGGGGQGGGDIIPSEEPVEGAKPLRNLQIGDENWGIQGGGNADALNENIIKKDVSTNTVSLKVQRSDGSMDYEDITPDVATGDKNGLLAANQKQILDMFRPYGSPEMTVEYEFSPKFDEYNPPRSKEMKQEPYCAVIDNISTMKKNGFRYYKEGSNHYWSANGEELPETHSVTHYCDGTSYVTYPGKLVPHKYNSFFMGCARDTYASVPELNIEVVWFVDNDSNFIACYNLKRLTCTGPSTPQTFELRRDDEIVSSIPVTVEYNDTTLLDGVIVDVPEGAAKVIIGVHGADIVGKVKRNWFFWTSSYKKNDNFIADNLRVDRKNVIGMPEEEVDYNTCQLIEIPTNYLTDFVYPGGNVADIDNGTPVYTKDIPFDYAEIEPYRLFIAIPESIGHSKYPNVIFLDENKRDIGHTSGGDYFSEPNILIKGYYGLLRPIPTDTKYLRFGMNYLTRAWLRVFYLKNKPLAKVKTNPTYSYTGENNLVFGDSIIGNFSEYNFAGASIPHFLTQELGATFTNVGFGGCRMTDRNDAWNAYSMTNLVDSICSGDFSLQQNTIDSGTKPDHAQEHLDSLKNTDFNKVNTIIIAYGINDIHQDAPLGTLVSDPYSTHSKDTELDRFDRDTYIGATQYCVQKLQKQFPNLRIILSGMKRNFQARPLKNYTLRSELPEVGDTNTMYFVKEEFKTYLWNGTKYVDYDSKIAQPWYRDETLCKNDNGNTIPEFNEGLKQVADLYGIEYIDNMNLGITRYNAPIFYKFSDGTHPNQHGRYAIAQNIANYLKNHDR